MSRVQKLRLLEKPSVRPINTNSSISDIPVTISGFIIGMLVTDITEFFIALCLNLTIPVAAAVPMTEAIAAERVASIRVFLSAVRAAVLENSSRYQ